MKLFVHILGFAAVLLSASSLDASNRSKKRPKDPYARQMAYLERETPALASALEKIRKADPKQYASLMSSSQPLVTLLARYKKHKTAIYFDRLQERAERTGRAFSLAMDISKLQHPEDRAALTEQLLGLLRQTLADEMSYTSAQLIRDLGTVETYDARLVFWKEHEDEQVQELIRRTVLREPGWLHEGQRVELLSAGKSRSLPEAERVIALEARLTELAEQHRRSRRPEDRSVLMKEALSVAGEIRNWHLQYIEDLIRNYQERCETHSGKLNLWTEEGDRIVEERLQKLLSGQFALDLLSF